MIESRPAHLSQHFSRQLAQPVAFQGKLLPPSLFVRQGIEDFRGDRILLVLRQRANLFQRFFKQTSHVFSLSASLTIGKLAVALLAHKDATIGT